LFRAQNIAKLIGLIVALLLLSGLRYAHAQTVPIPNPAWPLDSVVNGSVHRYTVSGDRNYSKPSTFVWKVDGGRLFFDEGLTLMAGNGDSATVVGDATNVTRLWVVWDSFTQPLDTGFVYAYEVSADGCERSDSDPGKFSGMRIKVSAPPKARFLANQTITCSNEDGVSIDIAIEGMPPYDLIYSINGTIYNRHIRPADLIDSDYDGNVDNITIVIDDYPGTTVDLVYDIRLLEASSGGVLGEVLEYRRHMVYAYVQPAAPVITPEWAEVTVGENHLFSLSFPGENPDTWYWELINSSGDVVFDFSTRDNPWVTVRFDIPVGKYTLVAYYMSRNGCMSLQATHDIEVFVQPAIFFSDITGNVTACSENTFNPNEIFEFNVIYEGARTYGFTYVVYDYDGNVLAEHVLEYLNDRLVTIVIPNNFINDELPEINRTWKVKIISATNEEMINVDILDAGIEGGRDERLITIHPKPVIHEDIDFAN
jgi:hypothetical protein